MLHISISDVQPLRPAGRMSGAGLLHKLEWTIVQDWYLAIWPAPHAGSGCSLALHTGSGCGLVLHAGLIRCTGLCYLAHREAQRHRRAAVCEASIKHGAALAAPVTVSTTWSAVNSEMTISAPLHRPSNWIPEPWQLMQPLLSCLQISRPMERTRDWMTWFWRLDLAQELETEHHWSVLFSCHFISELWYRDVTSWTIKE